jgi:hypothetical protein
MSVVGLAGLWAISSVLDAIFYAFQDVWFTYALRWMQGRKILDRIGPRVLVIGGQRWSLLRDYFRAGQLEAPGLLQFADVRGGLIDRKFMDENKDPTRGTIVLLQSDDRNELSKPLERLASATKMAGNQSDGTRNLGTGPYVLLNTMDQKKKEKYKFPLVALGGPEKSFVPEFLENVFLDFYGDLKQLELQIAGQVIAAETAEMLSKVKIPFYKRHSNAPIAFALEAFFGILSHMYSYLAVHTISTLMSLFFGAARSLRVFEPGQGQSGLTVFTTQLVPPSGIEESGGKRNIKKIAQELYANGINDDIQWLPSPNVSAIPFVYAHLYDVVNEGPPPVELKAPMPSSEPPTT